MNIELPADVLAMLAPALGTLQGEAVRATRTVERTRVGRAGEAVARYNGWGQFGHGHLRIMDRAFPDVSGTTAERRGETPQALLEPEVPVLDPPTEVQGLRLIPAPVDYGGEDDDACDDEDCHDMDCATHHVDHGCDAECSVCDQTYSCCGYCPECEECHGSGDRRTRELTGGTYCRDCDHECEGG